MPYLLSTSVNGCFALKSISLFVPREKNSRTQHSADPMSTNLVCAEDRFFLGSPGDPVASYRRPLDPAVWPLSELPIAGRLTPSHLRLLGTECARFSAALIATRLTHGCMSLLPPRSPPFCLLPTVGPAGISPLSERPTW